MTLSTMRTYAHQRLAAVGIGTAAIDARLLVQYATGISHTALLAHPGRALTPDEHTTLEALLKRRLNHEPMAYILGKTEFYGLDFQIGPGALIPRPDSETLIDLALKHAPAPHRVLDLGVGPGTLLLSLLTHRPEAYGVGLDRAADALSYAVRNADALGLSARAALIQCDWAGWDAAGDFDLIVSNPPYIETATVPGLMPDVAQYEPHGALDGGVDGLDCYRLLAPKIARALKPEGVLVFEVGAGQAAAVQVICADAGLTHVETAKDLGGIDRALAFKKSHLD